MARRGENIFKRKNGLWEARYVKGLDACGKKKYGSVYAHTYREAKEKRMEVEAQITLLPQNISKRGLTLNALLEEWLYVNKSRIKQSTYQKYHNFYKKHIADRLGKYPVIYMNPILIKQYVDAELSLGLSASTVNCILVFIHTCMKYGNRQYGLPVTEIIYIKTHKKEMRVLSVEEQRMLTSYLMRDTDIYKLGVLVALHTGIRIGELCALTWKDVKDNMIVINKTIQRLQTTGTHKTGLVEGEPKSSSSMREIPIPAFLCELIESFRREDNMKFMSRANHAVIEPRVLQYQFKKHLAECEIEDANFHALRHTFATRCIEAGVDIKTLSLILGHSDIGVTANKYVHSSFEQKRASMNKLQLIM